jgi:TM2 domain-containing membrane protein YozV
MPYASYGPNVDAHGQPLSDKSKLTAGLLELFLGGFGVGRFYLGYTGIGFAQIAVTLLTFGIGGIWPFVDAIMMLTGKRPRRAGTHAARLKGPRAGHAR